MLLFPFLGLAVYYFKRSFKLVLSIYTQQEQKAICFGTFLNKVYFGTAFPFLLIQRIPK